MFVPLFADVRTTGLYDLPVEITFAYYIYYKYTLWARFQGGQRAVRLAVRRVRTVFFHNLSDFRVFNYGFRLQADPDSEQRHQQR